MAPRALGREQRQTLANGAAVSMLYDAGGRATSRAYRDAAGVPLAMYTATYDAVGNRTGVDELAGGFAYAYDASRQLIAEHRTGTSAYSCTFSYDGVGNRLTSTAADGAVTSYLYNPAHELLGTNLGGALTTFAYDAAGNTVRELGPGVDVTYTWDGKNRLTHVSSAGSMETYTYDASGLRRRKQAGGSTTNFVWDRVNLLAELDGSLARTAQYTDFPGVWGGLASQCRDGTSRHFVHDLSANTRALLDDGAVTDSYLYRAFGLEEAVAGSTVNVMRFGGQVGYYRDWAERVYVRTRYYQVGLDAWLTRDPAGAQSGAGAYVYANNMPAQSRDPSGQLTPIAIGCVVACACAGILLTSCIADAMKAPPGHRAARMKECLFSTIEGLPPWGKVAVGICFAGCFCCLTRALCRWGPEQNSCCPDRLRTPLHDRMHDLCDRSRDSDKRTGCRGDMCCSELQLRNRYAKLCLAARILF